MSLEDLAALIVTVEDREVRVYGEVMCTWLAKAEARSYAEDLRRHFVRALIDGAQLQRKGALTESNP